MPRRPDADTHAVAQAAGTFVHADATARAAAEAADLARQAAALDAAVREVDRVRNFVAAPEHILGRPEMKHGEIAEHVEVGIRRARDAVEQLRPDAFIESVHRTGPVDYVIGDDLVQSKFVNGVARNLDHVRKHIEKYPGFGAEGSYYHIPRDHREVMIAALRGDPVEGLTPRKLETIARKAREIEAAVGRPIEEVVRPGISDYADVKQGRVYSVLDGHEKDLHERDLQRQQAVHDAQGPSLEGAARAGLAGAAAGAGVRIAATVWRKRTEGRNLFRGEFTADDWKDLGVDAGKGAAQGGVSAIAIYSLTNHAGLAAPFAGAIVSSALSVAELSKRYHAGDIALDEFVELGQIACLEGAVVGLATAAGQTLIPIPVLGGLVGAAAGRLLVSLARDTLDERDRALADALRQRLDAHLVTLDAAHQRFVGEMLARYDALGDLTRRAFDLDTNVELRVAASVELARAYGVPDADLLITENATDDFFLS